MTLLGIFRGASGKTVKKHSEHINFEDLTLWLDKRSEELVEKEGLHDYLADYINFLKDKRWLLQQQAEEGKNVPEDLRPECEEILRILTFKENPSLKETILLNSGLEVKLEKVLPNQDIGIINPLLKLFSEINNAKIRFTDKVNKSGYPRIANLNKRLSSLQTYKYRVDKCEEELRSKRRRLYLTEEKKKEKNNHLNSLRGDPAGFLTLETREKNEAIVREVDETEASVLHFFSEIKPLLQKYGNILNANGLLSSYIDDPLQAFRDDEGLVIKHSLQHLRAVLNSGKFSWSVEENISLLEKLDIMEEKELEQMQMRLLTMKRQLEYALEPSVDKDRLLEIDDAEYRLQHFIEQIDKLEDEISLLEEKIDNLKDEWSKELQLFQNLVNIGFGIELEVKI